MKKFISFLIMISFFSGICFANQSQKQRQIKQELIELKIQIEQEKDVIKKINLENQIEIKTLEIKAQQIIDAWYDKEDITIQQAIQEAAKVKQEIIELTDEFEKILEKNRKQIVSFYDEQIKLSNNAIKKSQWETQEEYDDRIERKKRDLEEYKKKDLFENENEILYSMIYVTNPFIEKLNYFQTESFYDEIKQDVKLVSIDEFNASDFIINIKYNKKKYSLEYDFSNIGKENAEIMCQTQYQFDIKPMFSVNDNLEKELTVFNVKHLGMKTEKNIGIPNSIAFKGINKLSKYKAIYKIKNTKYKSLSSGGYHTVGLKKDGSVVACGNNDNGQCDVSHWHDIVSISAGNCHTVGLKKDGTVVACGNNYYGQCNVSKWEHIVAISAGKDFTVGLKEDGTVIAVGDNMFGQCGIKKWKDIVAISAGGYHTVGLKEGGTVIACGNNKNRQCDIRDWSGIIEISAGEYHTVGLMKNKTVVAIGNNTNWQCNIASRENIIAISAAEEHTVGLRKDGTVVATGDNSYGKCDVEDWQNIVEVSAGLNYTIGLKNNGTIVFTGNNYYDQCDVQDWDLN